jgi:hypothetical protein
MGCRPLAGVWSAGGVTGMPQGEVSDLLTLLGFLLLVASSFAGGGVIADEKTRREIRAVPLRGRLPVMYRAHPRLLVCQLGCIAGAAVLLLVAVILWLA